MASSSKKWGKNEFWGLGAEFDQDWTLTDEQKKLRDDLMELCRVKIRPNAVICDRTYEFPRKSLNALAELGLLGLIVPKELGGLGQNHSCVCMVLETLSRYGCPSTAMVYTMHIAACSLVLYRYHNNPKLKDLLTRLNKEKLIGTTVHSDPATGGHFWFALSTKTKMLDDETVKILKYGSWATSAGHADWYAVEALSPNFSGDYSNISIYLVYKDEVRASSDDWNALGMHGNQSGPIIIEGAFNIDRRIGPSGDGRTSNDEVASPFFHMMVSSAWNGISLACLDLGKKHVTRKTHADVGMRICDYQTIQDYFGDCVCSTNMARSHVFLLAQELDRATNNNDWSLHADLDYQPRSKYSLWIWQTKYVTGKNVTNVTETMLHACGGTGYKSDLGLERLYRDGKAAWVMGLSCEVTRALVGKASLLGMGSLDIWCQNCDDRVLHNELGKMTLDKKKTLAFKLLEDVKNEESGTKLLNSFQDTDFENPFNTSPPSYSGKPMISSDGVKHQPALAPTAWNVVKLVRRCDINKNISAFIFALPDPTCYTGCLPGQYIQVRVTIEGKDHERYFSPVSRPDEFGVIELVLRFETQGIISQFFQNMKPGDGIEVTGPCGGFEYEPNKLDEITLLTSGGGITPGIQLIRCILNNESDKTKIKLLHYSDDETEIFFKKELDHYANTDKRLQILYTLGEAPENWQGEEGFIDTEMIKQHVTKPDGIKHKIIMCGGPTMALACLYSLRSLGYPSEMIFIYGQFGTEQIRKVYGRNVKLSGHKCDE